MAAAAAAGSPARVIGRPTTIQLAPALGRERAHDLVYEAATRAREKGETLHSVMPAVAQEQGVSALLPETLIVAVDYVGEAASIAINPVAYTRLDAALASGTGYDADWRSRYREAYVRQNRAFLRFVQTGVFPEIASSAWDGYASSVVAEAGVRALSSGQKTAVSLIARPELYA